MELYDRLSLVCKANGTTVTAFMKSIGKGAAGGTNLKSVKKPDPKIISEASTRFNVSAEWLLGLSDESSENVVVKKYDLNVQESSLIEKLRAVDDSVRLVVYAMTSAALSQYDVDSQSSVKPSVFLSHKSEQIHLINEERGIKRVEGKAAAGSPISAVPDLETRVTVPAKYLADSYFIVQAKGDSMIDAHINDGDFCVFQKDAYFDEGKIMLVQLESKGEDPDAAIKRVFHKNGMVELRSANPAYAPRVYPTDEVRLMGVLVHILPPET